MTPRGTIAVGSCLITLTLTALPPQSAQGAGPFPHEGSVRQLAFSGDGKKLVALTGTGVTVWDVATGKVVRRLATPPSCQLLDCSPKSDILAVYGAGETGSIVELWETATGKRRGRIELDEPLGIMYSGRLRFSPDGKFLALHADSAWAYLLDLAQRKVVRRFGGRSEVRDLAFASDGKRLALATATPAVQVFDPATGQRQYTFEPSKDRFAYSVCFDKKGRHLAVGGWDRITIVVAGGAKHVDLFQAKMGSVSRVAFAADGRLLVSGSQDGKIRIWDVAAGKVLRLCPGSDWALAPDGKTLAVVSRHEVRLFNVVTGEERSTGCAVPVRNRGRRHHR